MTKANRAGNIQKQMAKAREALADAELLHERSRPSAALNRAYYAVHHAARAALLALGLQPRTHRGVSNEFNLRLVDPGHIEAEYLSLLGRIQSRREWADYDLEAAPTVETAAQEVDGARRFVERIAVYLRQGGLLQ